MAPRKKDTWMKLTSPATLKALMQQRDFSYARLARYAGCSKSFISHLVAGRKKTCGDPLATRIAEALSVPKEILFVEQSSAGRGSSINSQRKAA